MRACARGCIFSLVPTLRARAREAHSATLRASDSALTQSRPGRALAR